MINERPWLLSCTNIEKLRKVYQNYTVTYRELINDAFEKWANQSGLNHDKLLEKNILVGNQNDQYWHLMTNMNE